LGELREEEAFLNNHPKRDKHYCTSKEKWGKGKIADREIKSCGRKEREKRKERERIFRENATKTLKT